MKVAIVHDWLVVYAGAERVLSELLALYPQADLFSLVDFLDDKDRERLGGRRAKTSFIQKLPFARRQYRNYLPLMMLAVEQFDLGDYDLVISSSFAVAKGVVTGPRQLHVSYVHSPIRYAWDLQPTYLRQARLTKGPRSWYARALLHYTRLWDSRTANGVDHYIANSAFIAARIWKIYRREASVIYPPVDTERFLPGEARQDYYITASRVVPYKRMPMIAEAFRSMPDKRLIVIGDGPEMAALQAAAGPNVTLLGYQSDEQMVHYLRTARAFIFGAEEDFGIVPVEAQACGTPVIAFGRGGAVETVRGLNSDRPTGLFFAEQTSAAVAQAVAEFELNAHRFTAEACRENALNFSPDRFRRQFRAEVEAQLARRSAIGSYAPMPLALALKDDNLAALPVRSGSWSA